MKSDIVHRQTRHFLLLSSRFEILRFTRTFHLEANNEQGIPRAVSRHILRHRPWCVQCKRDRRSYHLRPVSLDPRRPLRRRDRMDRRRPAQVRRRHCTRDQAHMAADDRMAAGCRALEHRRTIAVGCAVGKFNSGHCLFHNICFFPTACSIDDDC